MQSISGCVRFGVTVHAVQRHRDDGLHLGPGQLCQRGGVQQQQETRSLRSRLHHDTQQHSCNTDQQWKHTSYILLYFLVLVLHAASNIKSVCTVCVTHYSCVFYRTTLHFARIAVEPCGTVAKVLILNVPSD